MSETITHEHIEIGHNNYLTFVAVKLCRWQTKNQGIDHNFFNQIIVIFLFYPLTYWHCFQVATFPFSDHNCPPIELIASFCQSAYSWLKEDIQNVVVVHCKAGMGRTGLMICSLLLFLKASHDNQLQRL